MSVLHRNRNVPADPTAATPQQDPAGPPAMPPSGRVARTRTKPALWGICTAAVALVVLIVFMLQNTRSVEVTFLWLHGSVPLALALFVVGAGVAILAMAVGEARVGHLRRLARGPR
jgi:uncharacterized integral membrane protein